MWSEYAEAFALGNAAILGNVCMLPLYPGLIALLAGQAEAQGSRAASDPDYRPKSVRWMGLLVMAGILTAMIVMAAILHGIGRAFADALPYVLPVAYGFVALLGIAMLVDRNPLERLTTGSVPIFERPAPTAYVYGLVLGPLTLPCTGPIILSAFVLGSVGGTGDLLDGIAYFIAFGLGFGWPLVLIPFLAAPVQQGMTRFLTRHHRTVGIVSGLLLLTAAAIGMWFDLRPNL